MEIDKIKSDVNKIITNIHKKLGNGFPDLVYIEAFKYELLKSKLKFVSGVDVQIMYDNHIIANKEIDFVLDDKLAIVIKAYKSKSSTAEANFSAYLRSTIYNKGLLINFSTEDSDTPPTAYSFPK